MPKDRIVSIGFLTPHDLEVLGAGFTRHFPVPDDNLFADLLDQLDKVEVEPMDSAWPDLIVAAIMAALALTGGIQIVRRARTELAIGQPPQAPAA